MTTSPLEEALFGNTRCLSMSGVVELVLGFTQEGVIKIGFVLSCLALAHFYFNFDKFI